MKHAVIILLAILVLIAANAFAQEVESLEHAWSISATSGKPVLMEFVHTD